MQSSESEPTAPAEPVADPEPDLTKKAASTKKAAPAKKAMPGKKAAPAKKAVPARKAVHAKKAAPAKKRRSRKRVWVAPPPPLPQPPPPTLAPDLVRMLRTTGVALLDAGQAVNDIEGSLHDIAQAYGATRVRFFVLPNAVFVHADAQVGSEGDFATSTGVMLRLDQMNAVDALVRRLKKAALTPVEAINRVREIYRSLPRFGPALVVLGHTLLTVGFGLSLDPAERALPLYAGLGAVAGVLALIPRRYPQLAVAFPVFAAFAITLLAVWLGSVYGIESVELLTPPLVSLLPGYVLTVAVIELANGQIVAGATRLIYGIAQLLLLAFGVGAGIALSHGLDGNVLPGTLGWWAPWAGAMFVAIGYFFFASAPNQSLKWLILALFCTVLSQQIGGQLLGSQMAGFVAGFAIVPVAQVISRFPSGPAPGVISLPSFWFLVPGSLGLVGLTEVSTNETGGLQSVIGMGVAVFAIALGVMVGTSVMGAVHKIRSGLLPTDNGIDDLGATDTLTTTDTSTTTGTPTTTGTVGNP